MGSTRLPSKIMLPVNGHPIFQSQINRLKDLSHPLYIATTTQLADTVVLEFAEKNNIQCFRGDETNVLSRYYECARKFELDLVVRLTSDCPLIDPLLVEKGIRQYLEMGDKKIFLSNAISRSYPRGFDFEIFSYYLLEDAYRNAVDISDKEHVTPYIWKNKSGNVRVEQIIRTSDASQYRLTLDTQEDFALLRILIEEHRADALSGEEIIKLMHAHPELAIINQHIEQKKD